MNERQVMHLEYNMANVKSAFSIKSSDEGLRLPEEHYRLADKNSESDRAILEEKLTRLIVEYKHTELAESEGRLVASAWSIEVKKAYYAVFKYFTDEDVFYGLHYNDNFHSVQELLSEVDSLINAIVRISIGVDLKELNRNTL